MKQPDNATDEGALPVVLVQPEAKAVLSDREIAEMLSSHLRDCTEVVKMVRVNDFHRRILETSVHRTLCGRKFLITTEYDCSIITLELVNEQ